MYKKILYTCILTCMTLSTIYAQSNTVQYADTVRQGESDQINLPFKTISKKHTVDAVTVINPESILEYDNTSSTSGLLGGRVPGLIGGLNVRVLSDALIVIDGIPRPLSTINVQEVDQVTVLRGVQATTLYGVQGRNGVILITTKRGIPNEPKTKIWAETGMGRPISTPNYLNSADYMELYNEALANDGLPALYTEETIDATRSGDNPLRYPDTDYYSSEFLNDSRPFNNVITEFSGGDEQAQYYVNAGWLNSGSYLTMGDQTYNRLNLRSNINFRISKYIKSNIDIVAIYDSNKGPNADFWGDAATLRPNLYPPLIDSSMVTSSDLLKNATLVKGKYLLGGTSQFTNNVYGNLLLGGYNNLVNAVGQFNNGIDVDLSFLTEGLSLKTFVSFDYNKRFVEGQINEYAVYQSIWYTDENEEDVMSLTPIGSDKFSGTQSISTTNIARKLSFYGQLNYSRKFGKHQVSALALAYADRNQITDVLQDDSHTHLAGNFNYVYDNKYIFDFSSAVVSSAKLPDNNRIGISPSVGLGWVMSEEGFLKGVSAIDFLKLNVSAGILNTDLSIADYYLYQDSYIQGLGISPQVTWADQNRTNNATVLTNIGNSDLFYEKREEVNVGIDAVLLDESLSVNVNAYSQRITNQITQRNVQYPSYLGGFVPFENYGEEKYSGLELGAAYRQSFGDFGFRIGANVAFIQSEVITRDERWENDYQYRTGRTVDALYGLEADGFFFSNDDVANHEPQSFGQVQAGDIKYIDQNNDGVIDQNDEVQIGSYAPDLAGGLNITLQYRNFTLFTQATFLSGVDRYFNNSYYWVYGDRKYSEVVLDRWTPETAFTAEYPRLTSQANNNNFRNSDFWLYDVSQINISQVQLNYNFPTTFGEFMGMERFNIYLRGSNLLMIAENKDLIQLNIGSVPRSRYFSVGLKAQF